MSKAGPGVHGGTAEQGRLVLTAPHQPSSSLKSISLNVEQFQ